MPIIQGSSQAQGKALEVWDFQGNGDSTQLFFPVAHCCLPESSPRFPSGFHRAWLLLLLLIFSDQITSLSERNHIQFNLAEAFLVLDHSHWVLSMVCKALRWLDSWRLLQHHFLDFSSSLFYSNIPTVASGGILYQLYALSGASSYLCAWVSYSLYSSLCANVGVKQIFSDHSRTPSVFVSNPLASLRAVSTHWIICIECLFRCLCSSAMWSPSTVISLLPCAQNTKILRVCLTDLIHICC